VDAQSTAIVAVANECAGASRPAALTSRPAEPAAASSAATSAEPAPTAAESASAACAATAWAAEACSSSAGSTGPTRTRAGLALDTCSPRCARRTLYAHDGAAQSEIILAALQSIAQRSVYQKRFVRIGRRLRSVVLGRGSRDLIQFIFRSSGRRSKAAALLLLRTRDEFSRLRLQLERPLDGRQARANLGLLAASLEPKHLDFHRVGALREVRQFVRARFVSGSDHAALALSGYHGRSRQRLAPEVNGSGLCGAGLSTRQCGTRGKKPKRHKRKKSYH